jgi:hypothetical protein
MSHYARIRICSLDPSISAVSKRYISPKMYGFTFSISKVFKQSPSKLQDEHYIQPHPEGGFVKRPTRSRQGILKHLLEMVF